MEEAIKHVMPSISLSVGDKIVGCLDTKYEVVRVNYRDLTVTFTDEKTGIDRIRSFGDISCEFMKIGGPCYGTVAIKVVRRAGATISLEEGDYIIIDQGNKVRVVLIDYLNEKVTINKYGDCSTLTFDEIDCGNYKKVID